MIEFLLVALGFAGGCCFAQLVPLPFLSRWVRLGWVWLLAKTLGRL